jgi:CubicO group peptidase (beta-lactamase class C family)
MSQTLLSLAIIVAVSIPLSGSERSKVKRLDGTAITSAEIDETVSRLMQAAAVTGAGIAILDHGKVVYLKAYGFRDKDRNQPLTVDSVMSAASFSKVAFAYMVMQLVDEGVLDLDKPINQYLPKPLPEYPNYVDLANDSRYKQITARMLLSHTSGFPNWRAFEDDHKLKIHFAETPATILWIRAASSATARMRKARLKGATLTLQPAVEV